MRSIVFAFLGLMMLVMFHSMLVEADNIFYNDRKKRDGKKGDGKKHGKKSKSSHRTKHRNDRGKGKKDFGKGYQYPTPPAPTSMPVSSNPAMPGGGFTLTSIKTNVVAGTPTGPSTGNSTSTPPPSPPPIGFMLSRPQSGPSGHRSQSNHIKRNRFSKKGKKKDDEGKKMGPDKKKAQRNGVGRNRRHSSSGV